MFGKSIKDEGLGELAYNYVRSVSQKNQYNPQLRANLEFLKSHRRESVLEAINRPREEFFGLYPIDKVRDFVYKNDSFTPRNMYLINPLYYFYYTYIVFRIARLYSAADVDFSRENLSVYYSGHLDFAVDTMTQVATFASFDFSYSKFQKKRQDFFGRPALRIDVKDFFSNIKVNRLVDELRQQFGDMTEIKDLDYFFKHCEFQELPQLHYSIASSILSQFYLLKFDHLVQNLLVRKNLHLVRFVDDMFLIHLNGETSDVVNNEILNEISSYLWSTNLTLNSSKTTALTADEFAKGFEIPEYHLGGSTFSNTKIISEKAIDLMTTGKFVNFIESLGTLERKSGLDVEGYKRLLSEYLEVNGDDANKVLRHIIFSRKWTLLKTNQLRKISANWRYTFFDPPHLTVLYLMVCKFLENQGSGPNVGKGIRKMLSHLLRREYFTFRDSLLAVTYLFQRSFQQRDLISRVNSVNPDYVSYLYKYVV
ncbi:RNA-directed DNA polymerase [Alicyclobacillus sp. SO9]|uniref:RNA-directed DNA polymerase n=1 Tax=Alicyclobacillus sp. SO9 TaxID=2665646 RepID=UPI0018E90A04|nr:RNA-directed DNA polymerase [Alicyclobacillus sp. SO9]QQE77303.1 hypothetical protein GI364_15195 [Alicyclobacillus sp. SO9]